MATCPPVAASAISCEELCAPRSQARNWVIVDRVADSLTQAGGEVKPDLRGVPAVDRQGRIIHVAGIFLKGSLVVTAGATNDLLSSFHLLGAVKDFFLQEKKWQYLEGSLDGRDLRKDMWLRGFSTPLSEQAETDPAIVTNIGAGDHTVPFELYFPLTQPFAKGREALRGIIPIAALQQYGASAFRFKVATTFPSNEDGLTIKGFTGNLDVFFDMIALDHLFVDQPWQLKTYENANLGGTANDMERTTEYLVVTVRSEDVSSTPSSTTDYIPVAEFGDAVVNIDGDDQIASYTEAELIAYTVRTIENDQRWQDPIPSLFDNGGDILFLFLCGPMPRMYEAMAAGPIRYRFASRATLPFTRLLHRTIACLTGERLARLGGDRPAIGVGPNEVPVTPNGQQPVLVAVKGQ